MKKLIGLCGKNKGKVRTKKIGFYSDKMKDFSESKGEADQKACINFSLRCP